MTLIANRSRRVVVLCCLLVCFGGALASDSVSATDEIANRGLSEVRLSPDGEYVAAIVRTTAQPQARNIVTMRLADGKRTMLTAYSDIDVRWFAWASDTRLLFSTDSRPEQAGQPARYRGAFLIDREGNGGSMVERSRTQRLSFLARVPGDRHGILITRPGKPRGQIDVYRLDLKRRVTKKVVDNDREVRFWLPDNAGRVRAGLSRNTGTGRERLLYRPVDGQQWDELLEFDAGQFHLLAFHADNRRLIAASRIGRERFVLLEFHPDDLRSGKVLIDDPAHDVFGPGSGELTQSRSGHLVSYRYRNGQPRIVYFDPRWEARQAAIDEALPQSLNVIVDFSDDERKLLVLSSSDDGRGDYYIFDDIVRQLRFLVEQAE